MAVIQRSIESYETTDYDPNNHFRGVTKMVKLDSGERLINVNQDAFVLGKA